MFQVNLKKNQIVLALFFLSLAARLLFAYHYLEDWDSVQYAMALHHYSIVDNLPHAPGYPIYVLLGRIVNLVLKNDTASLVSLSIIFGSFCVFPLYFLAKKMFNFKVALIACLFFLLLPVSWTISEVALTNIPGQFFLLSFIYFLYLSKNPKQIFYSCVFAGLILGVRFTEFPIIVSLIAFKLVKERRGFLVFTSIAALLIGLGLWLIPLIIISTPQNFFKAYAHIANYVFKHDSVLGSETIRSGFFLRINQFKFLAKTGFTMSFLVTLVFSFIYSLKNNRKNDSFHFILIWFISYLVPQLFLYNLELTRYLLPLAAPFSIIAAIGLSAFNKKFKAVEIALIAILIIILARSSVDQLYRFNHTTSPIEASVEFVKENLNPQDTTIIPTVTYRHFQYYAKEFQLITEDQLGTVNLPESKYYVLDYLPIKDRVGELVDFDVVDTKEFKGDEDIYNRVDRVPIYILRRKSTL